MKDARDILIDALKKMGANGLYERETCCFCHFSDTSFACSVSIFESGEGCVPAVIHDSPAEIHKSNGGWIKLLQTGKNKRK